MEVGYQTTYFKHLHNLSVCDMSTTCTCTVCSRQPPSLKDKAFYIVLNCVYNLDQFQTSCNTTYHQYVYAIYSGSLSVEQIVPAEFPRITADYRFHYYLPKQKFLSDCLRPDGQTIRAQYGSKTQKFQIVDDAIASPINHNHKWYCTHCERPLFSINMCPFTAPTRNNKMYWSLTIWHYIHTKSLFFKKAF